MREGMIHSLTMHEFRSILRIGAAQRRRPLARPRIGPLLAHPTARRSHARRGAGARHDAHRMRRGFRAVGHAGGAACSERECLVVGVNDSESRRHSL